MPKENFSKRVWTLYSDATKKVDENPDVYKPEIWDLQKKLEDGDEELVKIWKETRELCLQDMKKIFAELGSEEIDKWYFESEVEKPGIELVRKLQAEWKAVISEWALAINLEEYGLWRFLLLKSNGASLYSTKDIGLAFKKQADYPNYSKSLYIVGSEQEHHSSYDPDEYMEPAVLTVVKSKKGLDIFTMHMSTDETANYYLMRQEDARMKQFCLGGFYQMYE